MHSYTNKIVWDEAKNLDPIPIFWNSVMGYSHQKEQPVSNRTPSEKEMEAYSVLIPMLMENSAIHETICIGRKAEKTMSNLGLDCTYVRHPANGGVNKFRNQIRNQQE